MRFEAPLVPAIFKTRPNRFLGIVDINNEPTSCFIPNPGRMQELLHIGATVYLIKRNSESRKTQFDLVLVDLDGMLVSIDSRMPNKVISETIEADRLPEFRGLTIEKKEYAFGDSRLDFLLSSGSDQLLLEVKSCTLVKDGKGVFPDAPTARGSRHLKTLIRSLAEGRAAIFFLIQRSDAKAFTSNELTDPKFSETLREAVQRGVEVYAYNSEVTSEGVSIGSKVLVLL